MARESRRGQRQQSEKWLAWILIVVTVVLVAVGAVLWILARERNPPLGEDLCPVGREPAVYWAVLVDATEPYTEAQKA